jgi:predicted nucleic acid-binding protein
VENSPGWSAAQPGEGPPIRRLRPVGALRILFVHRERSLAELAAERQRRGRPGELRDTMIAGIVLASHATFATRNVKHFEEIAPSLVNPWEA